MLFIVGLFEIVMGLALLMSIWRYNLVDKYFRIGEIQESFMRAHSKRIDRWLERRGETEGESYLRGHPRILQWMWSMPAIFIIVWGGSSLAGLRVYMKWEIVLPIAILLGLMPYLLAGKHREKNEKAENGE